MVRTAKGVNLYTKTFKSLLVLKYCSHFRKDDPFDAAFVYECWSPTTNEKVILYDFYKQRQAWKPVLPE